MNQCRKKKKVCAMLMFLILRSHYEKHIKEFSQKRIWIKPWKARRKEKGCFRNLFMELQLEDPEKYRR